MTQFMLHPGWFSHKILLQLLIGTGFILCNLSHCVAQQVNEKMIPVFIYNFTKYMEWPNDGVTTEFIIGTVGNTPIQAYFEKMALSNTVKGHKVIIKQIHTSSDAQNCHIIYIPSAEISKLKEFTEALKNKAVLIVTDKAGSIRKGADINLFIDEDDNFKTKFELNKGTIENHGLKISKDLLVLAYLVVGNK